MTKHLSKVILPLQSMTELMQADPVTRYEHLVSAGILKADEHQRSIIQHLQRLHTSLLDYDPGPLPPQMTEVTPSFVGSPV